MAKILIIGNGPAGISAALYTRRAGFDTTIIGKGAGALGKAHKIENYYGFENPVSGTELIQNGIRQARRLGVEIIEDEVVGLGYGEKFIVKTAGRDYEADCVIIATGTQRTAPPIKGIQKFEGKGVSYCATCDAFFYRGANVAVIGSGEYALHEAAYLAPIAGSVCILTDGKPFDLECPEGVQVDQRKIKEIVGTNTVEQINFDGGGTMLVSGIFVAVGVAGSADLAKKIGVVIEGTKIVVDENMQTNVPGLFAAGDCTGGLLQISKAVSDGAIAGTQAAKLLRQKDRDTLA